jgi:hypothetical protein
MYKLNRNEFLKFSLLALASGVINRNAYSQNNISEDKISRDKIPMIHATDLYHIHCDPDDHWDLATIYALGYLGNVDLLGILIDYPSKPELGDPDVMGVAQLNYYTGQMVPSVVGSPYPMANRNDIQPKASNIEHQGINWLLDTLDKSKSPVVINIVGAATNVAVALKKNPVLFKKKCKAIYLNAGSANSIKDKKLEYNVKLNPLAYAAIFDAPCPVYWMPCTTRTNIGEIGEYGTYYRFIQKEILPDLPAKLQNFFLFMLGQKKSHEWFKYLNGKPETDLLNQFGDSVRHMWCTAGFLHAAGKKVTSDGEIVLLNSGENSVFSFIPVKTSCNDIGYVDWEIENDSPNRYIFHVNDTTNYQKAMTIAMKKLLLQLPQ